MNAENSSFSQDYPNSVSKKDDFIPQSEDMSVNYNILYGKYRALLKDKEQLELSFRNETLANEEQRACIQVLKQMLEEKFNLHGFPSCISDGKYQLKIELFH